MAGFTPVDFGVPLLFAIAIAVEIHWARRAARDAYEARDTLTSMMMGLGNAVLTLVAASFILFCFNLGSISSGCSRSVGRGGPGCCACSTTCATTGSTGWAPGALAVGPATSATIRASTATSRPRCASRGPDISDSISSSTCRCRCWAFFAADGADQYGLNLLYQFWFHTEAVDKCPAWVEALFNTPATTRCTMPPIRSISTAIMAGCSLSGTGCFRHISGAKWPG